MVGSVGSSNPAIAYAVQAPPAMKAGAVADAVQVTVLRMANDQIGKAALQLLQAAAEITGKGGAINITA